MTRSCVLFLLLSIAGVVAVLGDTGQTPPTPSRGELTPDTDQQQLAQDKEEELEELGGNPPPLTMQRKEKLCDLCHILGDETRLAVRSAVSAHPQSALAWPLRFLLRYFAPWHPSFFLGRTYRWLFWRSLVADISMQPGSEDREVDQIGKTKKKKKKMFHEQPKTAVFHRALDATVDLVRWWLPSLTSASASSVDGDSSASDRASVAHGDRNELIDFFLWENNCMFVGSSNLPPGSSKMDDADASREDGENDDEIGVIEAWSVAFNKKLATLLSLLWNLSVAPFLPTHFFFYTMSRMSWGLDYILNGGWVTSSAGDFAQPPLIVGSLRNVLRFYKFGSSSNTVLTAVGDYSIRSQTPQQQQPQSHHEDHGVDEAGDTRHTKSIDDRKIIRAVAQLLLASAAEDADTPAHDQFSAVEEYIANCLLGNAAAVRSDDDERCASAALDLPRVVRVRLATWEAFAAVSLHFMQREYEGGAAPHRRLNPSSPQQASDLSGFADHTSLVLASAFWSAPLPPPFSTLFSPSAQEFLQHQAALGVPYLTSDVFLLGGMPGTAFARAVCYSRPQHMSEKHNNDEAQQNDDGGCGICTGTTTGGGFVHGDNKASPDRAAFARWFNASRAKNHAASDEPSSTGSTGGDVADHKRSTEWLFEPSSARLFATHRDDASVSAAALPPVGCHEFSVCSISASVYRRFVARGSTTIAATPENTQRRGGGGAVEKEGDDHHSWPPLLRYYYAFYRGVREARMAAWGVTSDRGQ